MGVRINPPLDGIEGPCLYWPNKQVTVLSFKTMTKHQAKAIAKVAFKKNRRGGEFFKDCVIHPWYRVYKEDEWLAMQGKLAPKKVK